ncbi:MAG: DUF308 domain-containing protein [Silvibacterium sp.]|nr:DUF308 domain-containing protein [Silvibacterium sp.]
MLLILAGLVMIVLPFEAGIGIAIWISALIIAAGVFHLIFAVAGGSFGGYLWRTLIGILYMVCGIYLVMHPALALATFTIVLGVVFLIEGVLQIIAYFGIRALPGSGWMLFDGIVTVLLAILILAHWPSSAVWAIATLVGINLLISGTTRLGYLMAHRRAAAAATPLP